MARYTSELAAQMVGSRYDLILIASARARELQKKYMPKVQTRSGPVVAALEEIEAGKTGREMLDKLRK